MTRIGPLTVAQLDWIDWGIWPHTEHAENAEENEQGVMDPCTVDGRYLEIPNDWSREDMACRMEDAASITDSDGRDDWSTQKCNAHITMLEKLAERIRTTVEEAA